jgi:hypothetical protein
MIKNRLRGHHFETIDNIQTALTDALKDLAEKDFQQCTQGWKGRLQRCVASEGNYFEGDHVGV